MEPITDAKLTALVQEHTSVSAVLRAIGHPPTSIGSARVVREAITRLRLDTSHWPHRQNTKLGAITPFTENSPHATGVIKRVILRESLLPYACAECELGPEWQGKPLVLRLDHRNGVNRDHRLANLQFLCPNCDSQTATFCGRNMARARSKTCVCGTKIAKSSKQCRSCGHRRPRAKRANWPPMAELREMIDRTSKRDVAKLLGVAESSVRNHLQRAPPVGIEPT